MVQSPLIRETMFAVGLSAAGKVLALLVTLYLARVMAAAEFGSFSYARNLVLLLGPVLVLGFAPAANRFIPQYMAQARPRPAKGFLIFSTGCIFGVACLVSVCVDAILAGTDIISAAYRQPARIMLIAVPFYAVAFYQIAATRAVGLLFASLVPLLIIHPITLGICAVTSVVVLTTVPDASALAWMFVGTTVLVFAFALIWLYRKLPAGWHDAKPSFRIADWLSVAIPLTLSVFAINYVMRIPALGVGPSVAPEEFAVFSVALLMGQALQLATQPATSVFVPRISGAAGTGDTESVRRLLRLGTLTALALGALGFALVAGLGKPALALVSPVYASGYAIMLVFALEQIVLAMAATHAPLLALVGEHWLSVTLMLTRAAALTAAILIVLPTHGTMGVAVSCLIVSTAWAGAATFASHRALHRVPLATEAAA